MIVKQVAHQIISNRLIRLFFAWSVFCLSPAISFTQNWTGTVQCQLNVQTNDYSHQEVQTWTVTGSPIDDTKTVYPATWSVSGQGGLQRAQGGQVLAGRWNSNVPGMNARLRIFVRASDGRLVIKGIHSPLVAPGATNVVRQVGASQTHVVYAAGEWVLPIIEDFGSSTNVSGTGTTVVAPTSMPMQSGTSGTATCNWNFSKSVSGANPTPPLGTGPIRNGSGPVAVNTPPKVTPSLTQQPQAGSGTPQMSASMAAIVPDTAAQGATGLQVTLTGVATHFTQATTKADFGSGIQITDLKVASPTSVIATLSISSSAAPGPHPVMMTTGNEAVSTPNGFSVSVATTATNLAPVAAMSLPSIKQISPNSAVQESTGVSVTLTGFATHFASNSTVADFGPGVTVRSLTVVSPTQATAVLNVDSAAAATARTVTVKTGPESATLSNGFTVTVPPPPAVVSVYPNSAEPGETNLSVTVNAQSTHFTSGTTTLDFGPGITVSSVAVNSKTQATAVLSISNAAPSPPLRTVTAKAGSEIAKGGEFTLTPSPGHLQGVVPDNGPQGQPLTLRISGAETHFSRSTSVSIPSCQFQGLGQLDRNWMDAMVFCPSTTATGAVDVSVTSNNKTITLPNSFTITPAPDVYGHTMATASDLGLAPDSSRTISAWLDSYADSNWFFFDLHGNTLNVFLRDVTVPSDFVLEAYSASASHPRMAFSYQADSSGQKTLNLKDDGSHGVLIQVRPNQWNARVPKFTLVAQAGPIPQTSPKPFSFSDKKLAVPYQTYSSGSVLIEGINVGVPIYMENGGSYNINGGPYTAMQGVVYNGDRISLQGDVSATEVSYYYTVHVGDYSASWTITVLP